MIIKKEHRIGIIILSFILFSLMSVVVFSYLHFSKLYGMADLQFHLKRIIELKNSISHGNIFPMFSTNYSNGSSVMGMYPYLSMYIFVAINFIIHSVIKSYYMFAVVCVFLSLIVSFLSSLKFSKSYMISYIFALCYSLSSSFTFELFDNGDLGILTSLIFLPMVIFGVIDIINNSTSYLKFTIGIILMMYCQLLAVIITIIVVFIWIILNFKQFDKSMFINLLKSFILIILCTSIIWVPIVYLFLLNHIYTISFSALQPIGLKSFLKKISIIPIISIIFSVFIFNELSNMLKQMYIISIIIIIISSKIMPWNVICQMPILHVLDVFQYTFRFLIIPQILLCYIFAYVFTKYINKLNNTECYLSLFIIFVLFMQILSQGLVIYIKSKNECININNYPMVRLYNRESARNSNLTYLLTGNRSVHYLINGYGYSSNNYLPYSSLRISNIICNNRAFYSNNKFLRFSHIKYNTFSFYAKHHIKELNLPIVKYNGEKIKLYVNYKDSNININKYRTIMLYNIKPGRYIIKINPYL